MRIRIPALLMTIMFGLALFSGSDIATAIPAQRQIQVVGENSRIVYDDYIRYNKPYVQPSALIPEKPVQAAETVAVSRGSNSDVRIILKTAHDLLGSKYVYGGSGPNSFDCSGFTSYVYAKAGVQLPHLASSQYNYGKKVSRDQLIAGDLVFFSYYGQPGINHVGIYVGEGNFIHASSSRGGVTTSSMSTAYYADNYRGATRIIR